MTHKHCPGYPGTKFKNLVDDYPGTAAFPPGVFRTEWGPIFHRGRLNNTAKILLIGQDPAAHENVARRVLVGEAGRRVQGFIARLNLGKNYVILNAFLYSAFNSDALDHVEDAAISAYRNRWFAALFGPLSKIKAVVAFGNAAEKAWNAWKATPEGAMAAAGVTFTKVMHPTADSHAGTSTADLLASWNAGLAALGPTFGVTPAAYGAAFTAADLAEIPEDDLPAGVPAWMRGVTTWAARPIAVGTELNPSAPPDSAVRYKRRHILIEAPTGEVP